MGQKTTSRVYVKSPKRKWILCGGIASCAVPVILGVVALVLEIIYGGGVFEPPHLRSTLIFIGTALAVYFALFYVTYKDKTGFVGCRSFVWIGMSSATLAHIILMILCLFYWKFVLGGIGLNVIFMRLMNMNVTSWIVITLPGGALCGTLFWWVAVRTGKHMRKRGS